MPQLLWGEANLVAQSCQVGSSDVPAMPANILMSLKGNMLLPSSDQVPAPAPALDLFSFDPSTHPPRESL